MNNKKKILIMVIMGIILLLCGSFITMDWSRFQVEDAYTTFFKYPFSRKLKQIVSFLCTLIVWIAGKDCFDKKDSLKMKLIFVTTFLADMSFIIGKSLLAISLFSLCQVLLIYRNGVGFKKFISSGGLSKHKTVLILSGVLIICIDFVFLTFLFAPVLKKPMLYIIFGYALLLSISLWVGWAASWIGFFSKGNSRLIAIGMSLFFISDFAVGLVMSLNPGMLWLVSDSIIWVLYVPTLILLGFSGYNLKKFG